MFKFIFLMLLSFSAHAFNEAYYAGKFCDSIGGESEVVISDNTRVDCVTAEYAIEVDWGHKWYNGVGQSLHYATVTGKKPALALIAGPNDKRFVDRFTRLDVCPRIKLIIIPKEVEDESGL